jgi:hypothetical protein
MPVTCDKAVMTMTRRTLRTAAAIGLIAAAAAVVPVSAAASTGTPSAGPWGRPPVTPRHDSQSLFWEGTDSHPVAISGSAPYSEPAIGGLYGGYIGMAGNWAKWAGCQGKLVVWSPANAAQAATNHAASDGIGTGAYWFMAGPGVDPHYNGSTSEANSWGRKQAERTLADVKNSHLSYPVIFMDIEIPGNAPDFTPAPDNGWNTVYTSACSGVAKHSGIAASVDRADLNGYATYLTSHSSYKAGIYSAPDIWAGIFGTGTTSLVPDTYEWTYESNTRSLASRPAGWCLAGGASSTCARFFGGVTPASKYALMWQWSGGGGSSNGYGDFDQIDASRTP